MKKQWIVLTVVCSALMANAGVVTNFFADFQGAADGNISTAADINAGTVVGSWTITALEESKFESNPASNRRLALDQGKYDFTASLATAATLAHGVTFSIDFRNLRDGSVKYNDIRLKTDGGWNLLSLRLVPTANSTGNPDWLQRWNPDTASWTNVVEIFQNSPAIPNEVGMQTLQVVMDADGFGLFLDGSNLVGNLDYDSPGGTLESIRLSSPNTASGVWYDDISVLTQPVNSHFLADFQGAADGSITTNLDLNAGTSVGSWTTVALEESYFDSNPASNRRLALDQGTYDVTGVLSSNAVLANGVFFSIDFRNLRDGSVKYNDIRLKTAGGFNLLSLRLVPT
ncbi:hypothetical protein P4B35_23635, partial [Pontiellaceae bacterium B12227]|nr:hypothetical protein [Pontiellaceae bacterium B12227]